MQLDASSLGILLGVSALVAMLAHRARIPYTLTLVLAGLVLSLIPAVKEPPLSDSLIYLFLPALIFETAYGMRWSRFRAILPAAAWLALPGVLISVAVVAGGVMLVGGWDWKPALLLGVVISPTDPIAVIPTLRRLGVRTCFRTVLDAESMLNDGTAAVAFKIALALAAGAQIGFVSGATQFIWTVVCSIAIGAATAGALIMLAGKTEDHLVELTFSSLCAYGSFLCAQRYGFSGVLATLSAGIVFGNAPGLSERGRQAVQRFWEYLGFVANSCVFLLIGYRLVNRDFLSTWQGALIAIVLSLAGRAVAVYASVYLLPFVREHIRKAEAHLSVAAGLRGALSIALALGIPSHFPFKREVLASTFAVVAFSEVVQVLALGPIARAVKGREPHPQASASQCGAG